MGVTLEVGLRGRGLRGPRARLGETGLGDLGLVCWGGPYLAGF